MDSFREQLSLCGGHQALANPMVALGRDYSRELRAFLALPNPDLRDIGCYSSVIGVLFARGQEVLTNWINGPNKDALIETLQLYNAYSHFNTGKKCVTLNWAPVTVADQVVPFNEAHPPPGYDVMNPDADLSDGPVVKRLYEIIFAHRHFKTYPWVDMTVIRDRLHRLYAGIPTEHPDWVNHIVGLVASLARHI